MSDISNLPSTPNISASAEDLINWRPTLFFLSASNCPPLAGSPREGELYHFCDGDHLDEWLEYCLAHIYDVIGPVPPNKANEAAWVQNVLAYVYADYVVFDQGALITLYAPSTPTVIARDGSITIYARRGQNIQCDFILALIKLLSCRLSVVLLELPTD